MNKLGEKSLKTLEYYEILEKLAGQAASRRQRRNAVHFVRWTTTSRPSCGCSRPRTRRT